jgi:hypothetical protein
MFILFDHGTPKGLARLLPGHTITTAQARGWDKLNNGAFEGGRARDNNKHRKQELTTTTRTRRVLHG